MGLEDLGLPAIIVDARRAKAALCCRLNKTDANDAEGLAQLARTGLVAHLGLTPRRYQSGEVDRSGRISKDGDALARHMLYEAASALISRLKKWLSLKA